jgi:predicted HAD superfamily Cof-like phosphohydrolase
MVDPSTPHQRRVIEFMLRARQHCPIVPMMPDEQTRLLRARLIMEEALETITALGFSVTVKPEQPEGNVVEMPFLDFHYDQVADLVGIADGCADISVVTIGTLAACGIADSTLLEAIDRNNLEKFSEGHSWNEHGKLIKPPGHKPPDIDMVLRQQGWRSPKWDDEQMPKLT